MTKRKIHRSVMNALGGEELFDKAVAQYEQAVAEHANTINMPVPAANPLIEDLVRNYDGYEVEEDTKPELKQTIEQKMIEDYTMLKEDMEVLKQQMADMGVAVYEAREMAGFANGEVKRLAEVVLDLQNQMVAFLASNDGTPDV